MPPLRKKRGRTSLTFSRALMDRASDMEIANENSFEVLHTRIGAPAVSTLTDPAAFDVGLRLGVWCGPSACQILQSLTFISLIGLVIYSAEHAAGQREHKISKIDLAAPGLGHPYTIMNSNSKVSLIPWDGESATHRRWLYNQRVQCNWDHEKVEEEWRQQQIRGEKCMYWIVSSTNHFCSSTTKGNTC